MCVIEGVVIEGRKLGRTLGFPTANIELDEGCEVENGVYHSTVLFGDGQRYQGLTNIGTNPTIESSDGAIMRRAESYLLRFEGDIYGELIRVELGSKLRDEMRFESVEALREQVLRDIKCAEKFYNREGIKLP